VSITDTLSTGSYPQPAMPALRRPPRVKLSTNRDRGQMSLTGIVHSAEVVAEECEV
jgi:hypothetical protein